MITRAKITTATLALLIASTPLAMTIKRDHDLDAVPIDTYDQAGHTWEIRHSPNCKCK